MDQSVARTQPPSLGALFMAAPTPFLVLAPNGPRFTILEANDAYLRVTKRSRGELIGRALFEAIPDNPAGLGGESVETLSASLGRVLASRASDAVPMVKHDIPRPEGGFERRYWTLTNTPALDETGEVAAILHYVEDVTYAVQSQEQEAERGLEFERLAKELLAAHGRLASSEQRFRALFEQAALGMTVSDLTGRWTQVNRRMAEMLGHEDPGDLVGSSFVELTHPEDRDGDLELLRSLGAGEVLNYQREKRFLRRDGGVFWASVTAAVVRDADGRPLHRMAVVEDIDERKAADERRGFLARLSKHLREIADPVAMMEAAAAMLGERLGVAQAGFGEMDEAQECVVVHTEWGDGRISPITGVWRLDDFGPAMTVEIRAGRTVVILDVEADPRTSAPSVTDICRAVGVRAIVAVPLLRDGALAAILFAHHPKPRLWTAEEVALVEEVCARLWSVLERARAEARLRESEAFHRLTAEAGRTGSWSLDLAGSVCRLSPMMAELVDFPPDSLTVAAATCCASVHPDDLGAGKAALKAALADGAFFDVEFRVKVGGGWRWLRSQGRVVRDASGAPMRLEGASTDVTRPRKAEDALRASEALLGAVLDALPVAVAAVDAQGAVWRDNAVHRELWGPAPKIASVAEYGDWVGYWPETGARIKAHEWAAARALTHGEVVRNELFENQRSDDGRRRLILNNAAPVRDAHGVVVGAVTAQLDVTASRAAEEELRRTSELLRLIGDSAPDLIYAKDRDSRMLYANAAFQQVVGKEANEIIGLLETEWAPDRAEAEAFAASDQRVIEAGATLKLDEVFTGSDGRTRHYRSVKAPLRDGVGGIIGVVGVSSDVTERRDAEERERLLAREVDHRAKNMLMVVQSVVQLSRSGDAAALKTAVIGRIQALARAHSLLAASRWEGVELRALAAEELGALTERGAAPPRIEGPALRLRPAAAQAFALVLHELAANAVRHGALSTSEGRLEVVWRRVAAGEHGEGLALIWREDGGPPTAPPASKGFGLMVIQASVERQLKGELGFEWRETGLLCTISLPSEHLVPGREHAAQAAAGLEAASSAGSLRGRRILVVEDEALIALQIEDALKAAGCAVLGPAASVAEAAALIGAGRPEAAVLDINLGTERSYPIADLLVSRGVPFVFCTGYAALTEAPERFPGVTVLSKPLAPHTLTRAMERLIDAARVGADHAPPRDP